MYQKILLAYDGSEQGKQALLECADLAKLTGAETHLLAVVRMPSGLFLAEGFIPENLLDEEKKRTEEVLKEGTKKLTDMGFRAQGRIAFGEPIEEICSLAEEVSADLIVVGHQRRASMAARWWRSSVGSSLIEYAPCSVLIAMAAK
jgi:nucleotide-binding universal stress UspA family protein